MWDTAREFPPPYQPQSSEQSQMPVPLQVHICNIIISPQQTNPTTSPVQVNNKRRNCCCKTSPQSNLFTSAFLIFMSGGMNMAWKLGFAETFKGEFTLTAEIISSWFYGGIIGAIIGGFLSNYLHKKILIWLSSIQVIVSGILQVSDPNAYDVILASRYFNGLALGMIIPMTFVLIGEESVKSKRGLNAVLIDAIGFNCGILVQIIFSVSLSNETRLIGSFSIIFGIIAFVLGIYVRESPIFYMQRGEEQLAMDSLISLQPPYSHSQTQNQIVEQFLEHKCYLVESESKTFIQNAIYGLPALFKLCFYRCFMSLGFSYIVNFTFSYSMHLWTDVQIYPYMLYAFSRLLGALSVSFNLDSRGRKPPIIIGFFFCSGFAFAIGSIFINHQHYFMYDYMAAVKYLLIIYQFFAAISMASSSVYLCEAFPLPVKSYYIGLVFIVEMLIHVIIISYKNIFNDNSNILYISYYFLTLGGFLLGFLVIVAIFIMPETKQCSLRECLPKFYKLWNFFN